MLERPRDDAKGYDVMFVDAASQVSMLVSCFLMLPLAGRAGVTVVAFASQAGLTCGSRHWFHVSTQNDIKAYSIASHVSPVIDLSLLLRRCHCRQHTAAVPWPMSLALAALGPSPWQQAPSLCLP